MNKKLAESSTAQAVERGKELFADAVKDDQLFILVTSTPDNDLVMCTNWPAQSAQELRTVLLAAAEQLANKYSN